MHCHPEMMRDIIQFKKTTTKCEPAVATEVLHESCIQCTEEEDFQINSYLQTKSIAGVEVEFNPPPPPDTT